MLFNLQSKYSLAGDQPAALEALEKSLRDGNRFQTLLGVTGSGKTFTMANLIQKLDRPALVISHNKTLAAQLYGEFKNFFPQNAVEYFVSYYDYYQPEAYIPQTDTYIEKDSAINEEIERLRLSATSSLMSRRDVIVVASVSCIYGLGSPEDFKEMMLELKPRMAISRQKVLEHLAEIQYARNDYDFKRGVFRVRGESVDIYPSYLESAIRVSWFGDEVESLRELDPVSGKIGASLDKFLLFPSTSHATPRHKLEQAFGPIRSELDGRVAELEAQNKLVEAQRLRMRTEYDLEMLREIGFCSGIENYSRHISGRPPGSRPDCLLDYMPKETLVFLDESHVSWPQIRGMFNGDRARKQRLVDYGFRLPSALDNRPMMPDEFLGTVGQIVFASATPADYELQNSAVVAEQVVRPTGLLDPEMIVRPLEGQVEDLINEAVKAAKEGERILVTTLTKRMSEDLTDYLRDRKLKVEYLHSDIDALERVEILRKLRLGDFDVLVGVNLLREGLDLPEVALVAILDADKEGFLRSTTSLIQTAGRAARHIKGRVILYADNMNDSLKATLEITSKRRQKQEAYNRKHGITPKGVKRAIEESMKQAAVAEPERIFGEEEDIKDAIAEMEKEMLEAADRLDFERAAILRDQIARIKGSGASKKSKSSFSPGGIKAARMKPY
jgi:excinuclease ABC subunit B